MGTNSNEFCIQFRTYSCAELKSCSKTRLIVDKVHITFTTDGQRVRPGQIPIMKGFRIRYGIFDCPGFGTSECLVAIIIELKYKSSITKSYTCSRFVTLSLIENRIFFLITNT